MSGALLLELDKGTKASLEFCDEIRSALQETAEVTGLIPKTTIEIRDLDALTTTTEVEEAVKRLLPSGSDQLKVTVTKPNNKELVRAYVQLPTVAADKLLETGSIIIGWIRAKKRTRTETKRCFRCLGVGHVQRNCKGPDRTNLCIKCGAPGHKLKECTNSPKCCVCTDAGLKTVDHIAASGKCASVKAQR
ncbi:uncharacterized protein LOC119664390 [Teleopsis dalmanni]|uniref:uncharacterized protein LOC119664389 n=1 Tax=Teleopsis dalmanni TaxID=139649 RepID=UPI0018CFCB56|nr:uncharacterized protein LOC119664389 [Teleopsis dalmanni]XP_037929821.1 uncharacterized protein LOC119664390 [Teleopsis dalmanni]